MNVNEVLSLRLTDLVLGGQALSRHEGRVVFVDRGHAPEASRRALCSGLTEIQQRHAGRSTVTSGLVTHL